MTAHLSLEARANIIADIAGRIYADPAKRRQLVHAAALEQLRIVDAKAYARPTPIDEAAED